jgi:chemotaxis response regulator CheB
MRLRVLKTRRNTRERSMAVRILIADDDSTIRNLLRRLLERNSDWQVCGEAVNGVTKRGLRSRRPPDTDVAAPNVY